MSVEKRKTGCESPTHNEQCPCITCTNRQCMRCPLLTKDHFTPKCIALKVFNWSYKRVSAVENIQWLSQVCHTDKDSTTEARFRQTKTQFANGATINFKEHIT